MYIRRTVWYNCRVSMPLTSHGRVHMKVKDVLEALKGADPEDAITVAQYDGSGDLYEDYAIDEVKESEVGGWEITFVQDP